MQNLKCDICGKYLPLCRGDVIVNADYCENNHCYKIGYKNVPLFHCAECNESYLPEMTELFFREFLNTSVVPLCITSVDTEDIEWDDFIKFESIFEKRFNDGPFSSNLINFLFDPIDYFFIDGLEREHNIGFLTPVFFNIEVLLKFMHHPRYSLDICSNTMGYIYHDKEHYVTFGINNNNRVILWLGDLLELSDEEQYYFRSENVPSDHSIGSEFYEAQIEARWAEGSVEKQVLKSRNSFNERIMKLFSIKIFQLDTETIKAAKKIQKLLIDTEDAFMNIIIPLTEVLVESINPSGIKQYLTSKNVSKEAYKELKGIKLLQLFLETGVPSIDAGKVLCPLYVLYDFRVSYAHILPDQEKKKKFESCLQRLNIDTNTTDFTVIMSKLYDDLNQMYTDLLSAL